MKYLIVFILLFSSVSLYSQQASYSDPAQAYMRIVLENQSNPNEMTRVGSFNVKGTPMLYGGRQNGSVFTKTQKATNITLSYNTYNQQLEIHQSGTQTISKENNEIDSFNIVVTVKDIPTNLNFYNASLFNNSGGFFLQEVVRDGRFHLYKKYSSSLGVVSTNYIESGLRQFDLNYEYYYFDSVTKEMKKFKHTINAINKEFKKHKDVSSALDTETFNFNPEAALINVFSILNN